MLMQIYYSVLLLSAGVVVIYLVPNKYQKVVSLLCIICIIGLCALIIYIGCFNIKATYKNAIHFLFTFP